MSQHGQKCFVKYDLDYKYGVTVLFVYSDSLHTGTIFLSKFWSPYTKNCQIEWHSFPVKLFPPPRCKRTDLYLGCYFGILCLMHSMTTPKTELNGRKIGTRKMKGKRDMYPSTTASSSKVTDCHWHCPSLALWNVTWHPIPTDLYNRIGLWAAFKSWCTMWLLRRREIPIWNLEGSF